MVLKQGDRHIHYNCPLNFWQFLWISIIKVKKEANNGFAVFVKVFLLSEHYSRFNLVSVKQRPDSVIADNLYFDQFP